MKTSIVVLTRNQLELTRLCIESIRDYTPQEYELIIVDNGSTDGTVPYLEGQHDIKLVKNEANLGFARGCNQGIELASGENVLFLNNDTVVTPFWLRNLLRALYSSEEVGMVGPVSNSVYGPQQVPVTYSDLKDLEHFAQLHCSANAEYTIAVRRLVGFCLLLKRSVLDEIGPFDEDFGLGNFEDDDLCLRALRHGYVLLVAFDSFIHHFGHSTFGTLEPGTIENWYRRNREKAAQKWGEDIVALLNEPRITVSLCLTTHNHYHMLGRCLDSVKDLVEEIIIVDTGSTDGTQDLAREYTDHVLEVHGGDLSVNDLFIHEASMDFVFWLDVCEMLSVPARKKFRALRETLDSSVDVVSMSVQDGDARIVQEYATRLCKKGRVDVTLPVRNASSFGDSPHIFHSDIKLTRITQLTQLNGDPVVTQEDERCTSMRFIAKSWLGKGNYQESSKWLYRAIAEAPHRTEPYVEMAQLAYLEQDWPRVYHMVQQALKIEENPVGLHEPIAWDLKISMYDLGALSCYELGMLDKSLELAITAARLCPHDDRLQRNVEVIRSSIVARQ